MAVPMRGEKLLTVDEVAEWVRFEPSALRQRHSKGLPPKAFKIGSRIRYREQDVVAWLEAQNPDH